MSLGPFLLRLLLSSTLVLNGGSGWAMPVGHAGEGDLPTSAQPESPRHAAQAASSAPCHQSLEDGAVELPVASDDETLADAPATDDCCSSVACACDCLHQGAVVGAAPFARLHAIHDPQPVLVSERAHAAPRLAHLIRPPIG